MTLKATFINDAGRIRSGWRVLIFALVFFVMLRLLGAIIGVGYYLVQSFIPTLQSHRYFDNLVFRGVFLLSAVAAGYACNRWLEGLPWRALGLGFHRRWFQHLVVGSLLGVVSLAFAAVIATAAGGLSFAFTPRNLLLAVMRTLFSTAALFVVAALAEEVLFRGYPLQTLTRARLAWLGVLLTALPFLAAHLGNPNSVLLGSINTGLAGLWLAVAYLRTRSLWFPLGVHWAWNWALGSLFGLPVSGMTLSEHPLLRATDLGPAWLTGGSYGIEGGIACTIALLVSTLFIWRTRLLKTDDELLQMTSHENPIQRESLSILDQSPSAAALDSDLSA